MTRAWAWLAPLLLLGPVAASPTSCDGGAPAPLVETGVLGFGERVAFGITDTAGASLLVEVHSAQVSHGWVEWALRDQATGEVLLAGHANEFSLPRAVEDVSSDALCLEVLSMGSVRHYLVAVVALP